MEKNLFEVFPPLKEISIKFSLYQKIRSKILSKSDTSNN